MTEIIENDSPEFNGKPWDDREQILSLLREAILYLHDKALSGRIRDKENEKTKIAYFRVLSYTASIWASINQQSELSELTEEVEELKSLLKNYKSDY